MAINDNWVPWNAKAFGAVSDGVTDDTVAIQAAINYNKAMGFLPLPVCQTCPNEVKPGEDLCWACLGENPEDRPYEWENLTFTVSSYGTAIFTGGILPTLTTGDSLVFTWTAQSTSSVTGLSINETFSKTFSPINVTNGDSIQWTIKDIKYV